MWRIVSPGRIEMLEGQLAEAHATIERLTALLADLKREGFTAPASVPEPPSAPVLPPEVEQAIASRAPNPSVAAELAQTALWELKTKPAEEVAELILAGGDTFDWDD